MAAPGGGFLPVDRHPETGVTFSGFQLPFWAEVCALARRAARAFLPIRTIGWDFAMTAGGPCLIEGNFWADPLVCTGTLDEQVAKMRGALSANPSHMADVFAARSGILTGQGRNLLAIESEKVYHDESTNSTPLLG